MLESLPLESASLWKKEEDGSFVEFAIRAAVLGDVFPVVEVKRPVEGVRDEPEGGVKAYQRQPDAGADPGVELIEADPPENCVQKYRVQFVKVQSPHINRLSRKNVY